MSRHAPIGAVVYLVFFGIIAAGCVAFEAVRGVRAVIRIWRGSTQAMAEAEFIAELGHLPAADHPLGDREGRQAPG